MSLAQAGKPAPDFRAQTARPEDTPATPASTVSLGERFETSGLWPYYRLFDAEGRMKTRAAGNAGLTTVETAIKRVFEMEPAVTA